MGSTTSPLQDVIIREAQPVELLSANQLQQFTSGETTAARLMDKAHRTIETAGSIVADDPDGAYFLAYDAARHACSVPLARQGLGQPARAVTTPSSASHVRSSDLALDPSV